jgi:hypothetical protein
MPAKHSDREVGVLAPRPQIPGGEPMLAVQPGGDAVFVEVSKFVRVAESEAGDHHAVLADMARNAGHYVGF